jgi:tetratricopeptide (TPR) repeat protein
LARLDDRFRLLRSGSHDRPDRHATARSTIDWSYHLLSRDEQLLFDRLSVCSGHDLATAEALGADGTDGDLDVVELLRGLVDKSMIVTDRHQTGSRYRMLETLREYGLQNLQARGRADEMRQLHLDHFLAVAERADDVFRAAQQVKGAATFEAEWDNLRAAHMYAVQTSNLPLAERLIAATRLFAISIMRIEHADWVLRTLALGTDLLQPHPDTFAQAAWWVFNVDEDGKRADELVHRGLELAPDLDSPEAAMCLALLDEQVPDAFEHFKASVAKLDLDREWWAVVDIEQWGRGPEALDGCQSARLAQLVQVANRVGSPTLVFAAEMAIGHQTLLEARNPTEALEHYRRAVTIARESGDRTSEGEALRAIAFAMALTDPTLAAVACREALESLYDIRNWFRIWQMFDNVAYCLVRDERFKPAAVIVGFLEATSRSNLTSIEDELGLRDVSRHAVRSRPELAPEVRLGATMDRHEVVAYVLTELERFED